MILLVYIIILLALIAITVKVFQMCDDLAVLMAIPFALFLVFSSTVAVKEIKTEIENPLIEQNEYRVIITVDGKEYQYKDAYTVKNAQNIKRVYLVKHLNGWGFQSGRSDTLEIKY